MQGSDIKCITEEHYGYYHGKPCLLLKLNRIYGWRPQPYYNLTEVANTDMPQDLKDHIFQVNISLIYKQMTIKSPYTDLRTRCD